MKIVGIIFSIFVAMQVCTANDIELIQFSDLRLRNLPAQEQGLFRTWTLVGNKNPGAPVTITFEQNQVYGSDGCNRYSAPVKIAGNDLKFGPIMATRTVCEQLKGSDSQFRRSLVAVESYRITEKGLLELLSEAGNVLFTFQR